MIAVHYLFLLREQELAQYIPKVLFNQSFSRYAINLATTSQANSRKHATGKKYSKIKLGSTIARHEAN